MSARRYFTVWCDGVTDDGANLDDHAEGCPMWSERSSAAHTASEARQQARIDGWRSAPGGRDYSPQCFKALPGPVPSEDDPRVETPAAVQPTPERCIHGEVESHICEWDDGHLDVGERCPGPEPTPEGKQQ